GTSADFIYVNVGNNVWKTPNPGEPGALNGIVTSVTIPAGTLQAGSDYTASIGFYHALLASNITYVTEGFRATTTEFNLSTISSSVAAPVIANPVWTSGGFSFDIDTTVGQLLTILYSTNCTQPLAQWQTLLT